MDTAAPVIHSHSHLNHNTSSVLFPFDARAKLCAMLLFLTAIITSPLNAVYTYLSFAILLAFILPLSGIGMLTALRRSLIIAPLLFGLVLSAPFLPHNPGDVHPYVRLTGAASKAWLGVLCAIWLGGTTPFADLLTGLARLRVPPILILTTGFIYRYLFLISGEITRTRRAMTARGFQLRKLTQAKQLGPLVGMLFLRCHARAERTHFAMLARGYRGGATHPAPQILTSRDYLLIVFAFFLALTPRCLPL